MKTDRIEHGYSACAGMCADGWFAGVLLLEDKDTPFCNIPEELCYEERVEHWRRWTALTTAQPRRLALVLPSDDGPQVTEITASDRIDGPVCPKETVAAPVLAWTARRQDAWELCVYEGGRVHVVQRSAGIMRFPQLAVPSHGIVLAYERDDAHSGTEVAMCRRDGTPLSCVPGRRPVLAAAGDDVLLLTEEATANEVALRLRRVDQDGQCEELTSIHEGDYTFNADLAWSSKEGAAYVVAESSPRFGYGSQFGVHRTLHVWRHTSEGPQAMPGGGSGIPVERRGFMSLGPENLPPIQPRLLLDGDTPVVLFRQFRRFKFKTFGWDVNWSRWNGTGWEEPVRLTPSLGSPDAGYAVLATDGSYVAVVPSLHDEGGPSRATDHRVEILEFGADHSLPRFEVPEDAQADYTVPVGPRDIAPEPPPMASPFPGRTLVWGDMHAHTTYSKCVASCDGNPVERLRYARDVLGCQVFTLTEHTPYTTGPESTWMIDCLERMAGDHGIVLYSTEPGMRNMRDNNWYTRNRETFERLERLLIAQRPRIQNAIRHVREELPQGAVFLMRHFHGRAIEEHRIPQHVDPQLEVAMESMQGRCNALLDAVNTPLFPTPFLNAGMKIGLVGGTDHFRSGPNHYCLTGFWVKDASADGVWEAIRNRYTIAMSDGRVAMAATCGGVPMGGDVTIAGGEPVRIMVHASCASPILRATLIRDGELLPWVDVGSVEMAQELTDADPQPGVHWYVPTIEIRSAYGDGAVGYCHASPFFVWVAEGRD